MTMIPRRSFGAGDMRFKAGSGVREQKIKIATIEEVPVGGRKLVEVDGLEIALFNLDGRYYAMNNVCPHRQGPLIRGKIDQGGVYCPMHGWRFELETGECRLHPHAKAKVYPVHLERGALFVDLDVVDEGVSHGEI
jgi:nitrite reductase/ring-hydroxylating ferredoxin subunit